MFPSDRIVLQAPVAKSTRTSLPPSLTMARSFAGGNAEGMRSHRGQARQARQSAAAHVGADQLIATVHLCAELQPPSQLQPALPRPLRFGPPHIGSSTYRG